LAHKGDGRVLKRKVTQRQRKHVMTFGDFHSDALEAVNRIFSCAEPLISLEALTTTMQTRMQCSGFSFTD
jgi:hypothetical protein